MADPQASSVNGTVVISSPLLANCIFSGTWSLPPSHLMLIFVTRVEGYIVSKSNNVEGLPYFETVSVSV